MRPTHVILDRDDALNEEAPDGGYVSSRAQWRWIPGALEALAMFKRGGLLVSVVTNHSGVGRGIMSYADLDTVHALMTREAEDAGGAIAAIFACPHAPE